MLNMPVWAAKLATLSVLLAVVMSAGVTCVPGAMSAHDAQMPGCGSMHMPGPGIAADVATNCCVRHEPALTAAKIDLRQIPLRPVASPALATPATLSAIAVAHRAETPPGLASSLAPPIYISLSTLRI